MADTLACEECGHEIESADGLETVEAPEVETDENGAISLYGSRDLFRCTDCRAVLGVSRRSK